VLVEERGVGRGVELWAWRMAPAPAQHGDSQNGPRRALDGDGGAQLGDGDGNGARRCISAV
jgi:hypothetical protein